MIHTCITCDNFRYIEKGIAGRLVLCDLMYEEDKEVDIDLFKSCFYSLSFCDEYVEMNEDTKQEME